MGLKKILSKKKAQAKYFLEVEVKDQAPEIPVVESTETNQPQGKKNPPSAPTPKPTVSNSNDQPEWVKAIKNYSIPNSNDINGTSSESETFAGKYITNDVPQLRRRPGGSLKLFKNIASQINK